MKTIIAAATASFAVFGVSQAATIHLTNLTVGANGIAVIENVLTPVGELEFVIAGVIQDKNDDTTFHVVDQGLGSGNDGVFLKRNVLDNHQVDGSGRKEGIVIQAQRADTDPAQVQPLNFTHFSFTYVSGDDEFSVFAGDSFFNLDLIADDVDIPGVSNPAGKAILTPFLVEGVSTIVIAALEKNDDWKLKSFSFNVAPDVVDPVPLPGALALFAAGFAGVCGFRRRA